MATLQEQPVALKPSQARNIIYTEELDFSIDEIVHSDIQYTYCYPTNIQTVTLTSSGNAPVVNSTIPPSVTVFDYNRLNYQLQVAPNTAGANTYIWCNANALTHIGAWNIIDQFGGAQWAGLTLGNFYGSMVGPGCVELNKFLTKSFYSTVPSTTSATSSLYVMNDISRFSQTYTITATTVLNSTTDPTHTTSVGSAASPQQLIAGSATVATTWATTTTATTDLFPQNPYTSRRQFYISGSNTGLVLDFSIQFSAWPMTAMALHREVYNPTNIISSLFFNATDNFVFNCGSATDPTSVATINGSNQSINATNNPASAPFAAGAVITNISFSLANENNPELAARAVNQVTQGNGLYYPIGYPTIVGQTQATSTLHVLNQPVTNQYGTSLLGIIVAPFSAQSAFTQPCFRNVHKRGNITNYQTLLATKPLGQQTNYDCTLCQDYTYNKKFLEGSSVQTLGEYIYAEWIHVDTFVGMKPLYEFNANVLSGRDIRTVNTTYQMKATLTNPAPYDWYIAFLGQKMLHLTARGSQVLVL